jgi:hypothetical protein
MPKLRAGTQPQDSRVGRALHQSKAQNSKEPFATQRNDYKNARKPVQISAVLWEERPPLSTYPKGIRHPRGGDRTVWLYARDKATYT